MIRIDFHTHSEASKDGGITPEQYAALLRDEKLDVIAITDHDRIDFAQGLQDALGEKRIIIGEEITSAEGEIIGLYLTKNVEPGQSAEDTIAAIKNQGGLVYIPHPFETVRNGITLETLNRVADSVDIVEGCNGRAMAQNFGPQATTWARQNNKAVAASSDAHGIKGMGHTHTIIQNLPSQRTLLIELAGARIHHKRPPFYTLFYPKFNRLKNLVLGNR